MQEKSKTLDVLNHLEERGSITSLEAFELYGATRLSAIIFNLRKSYDISSEEQATKDRYGHSIRYAKYVYHGKLDTDKEKIPELFGQK